MFCPECGKEIRDDARYCPECGAYIEGTLNRVPDGPQVPGGSPDEATRKKRRRRALIIGGVVIACAFVAGIVVSIASVTRAYSAAHGPHPVTFIVGIDDYDKTCSRIPVEITGKDTDGNEVNETIYLEYVGEQDCELKKGTYHARILGSPITGKGKIFEIPTEEVDFEVSESLKPGEECVVESGDSFKFEPVKADEVTDDEIKDAVEWAKKDEGLDLDVDALEKAAYKRRDDAKAGIDVDFEVHMDTPTSGVF
jgi:hypothetical protein